MRVVHCQREPYTHYIGRPSPFGNPFSHRPSNVPGTILVTTVSQALRRFEGYARENTKLLMLIEALPADAVLGCWCGRDCHGYTIIKLWDELHGTV